MTNLGSLSGDNCGPGMKGDSSHTLNATGGGGGGGDCGNGVVAGSVPSPKELLLRAGQNGASQNKGNNGTGTVSNSSGNNHNSSIVDINSRLEFLCRQMTEQAIN